MAYAWPIIRLAELYLNYAEAYNEYYGPGQEVFNALNEVRSRSGIPDIEEVWSNSNLAVNVNKHLDKDGLREIIQQERLIEMAFEGHRYYDIQAVKGHKEFQTLHRADADHLLFFYQD